MDIKSLAALYRHMEWADASVWTSLLASEGAQKEKKVREYLYHLHMVQWAFLRIWRGVPRETPFPEFDDPRALMGWARDYYGEIFAHLESLNDDSLMDPLIMPWADMVEAQLGRPPEETTIGETVLQVALHSTYHRGQVNLRLREAGVVPPLVDYIAWVWLGRPAPAWP